MENDKKKQIFIDEIKKKMTKEKKEKSNIEGEEKVTEKDEKVLLKRQWISLANIILNAAEKAFGSGRSKENHKSFVDNEVLKAMEKRDYFLALWIAQKKKKRKINKIIKKLKKNKKRKDHLYDLRARKVLITAEIAEAKKNFKKQRQSASRIIKWKKKMKIEKLVRSFDDCRSYSDGTRNLDKLYKLTGMRSGEVLTLIDENQKTYSETKEKCEFVANQWYGPPNDDDEKLKEDVQIKRKTPISEPQFEHMFRRKNKISEKRNYKENITKMNRPFTNAEVREQIKKMKTKKRKPVDGILSEFLIIAVDVIVGEITKLCNESKRLGFFPEILKRTETLVLRKSKGNFHSLRRYRDVVNAGPLYKLYTKLWTQRMNNWNVENNAISKNNFAYMKCRSTADAALKLYDVITNAMATNAVVHCIQTDFTSCFRRPSHKRIMKTMERYFEIGKEMSGVISDYLTRNTTRINIDGTVSKVL